VGGPKLSGVGKRSPANEKKEKKKRRGEVWKERTHQRTPPRDEKKKKGSNGVEGDQIVGKGSGTFESKGRRDASCVCNREKTEGGLKNASVRGKRRKLPRGSPR